MVRGWVSEFMVYSSFQEEWFVYYVIIILSIDRYCQGYFAKLLKIYLDIA